MRTFLLTWFQSRPSVEIEAMDEPGRIGNVEV
jgi:hypothetical protein